VSRGCKVPSVVCVVVLTVVGGVEGGGESGPLSKVVLAEVVCVALVVFVVSRGRKVASVVCTAVLVCEEVGVGPEVGESGGGLLPKLVLDGEDVEVVVVEDVEVVATGVVAQVVCVAVVCVVVAAVGVRAVQSARPSLVGWQPLCCSAVNSRSRSWMALAWARSYCCRRPAADRLGRRWFDDMARRERCGERA
jgi:hypothetical protein